MLVKRLMNRIIKTEKTWAVGIVDIRSDEDVNICVIKVVADNQEEAKNLAKLQLSPTDRILYVVFASKKYILRGGENK